MRFNAIHKHYFNADDGAFSVITSKDEALKRQITLTDYEAELAELFFGKSNILIGPKKSDPATAMKPFVFYNSGKQILLPLIYPKPGKNELRLYMSSRMDFMPKAGDVWFIFRGSIDKKIYIGWLKQEIWNSIGGIDDEDAAYQAEVNSLIPPIAVKRTTFAFPRDRVLAQRHIKISGYKCEFDASHKTFTSPITKQQFMEVHHLVPVGAQKDFGRSLDIKENLLSLCPNCHRAVHFGEHSSRQSYLSAFFSKKFPALNRAGIKIAQVNLFAYYNCT